MSKKIFFSGVQPSGKPHIGNYFGAMKQFVDLQKEHDGFVFIVDYHALHSLRNPKEMSENIKNVLLDYLAIGLDPEKVTIAKQSDVSEHTELCWIFDTVISVPNLMLAHAFKARVDQIGVNEFILKANDDLEMQKRGYDTFKDMVNRVFKGIDVGTFNYPVLMAADILLYGTDIVPVGADQKQHVEIARDIAEKFNNTYGETFKLPEHMILKEVAIVPGTDGRKMSKSYGNTIALFAEYEEIKKCVMSIVTDSGEGIPKNVYAIHKLVRSEPELKKIYEEKVGKYKELKELLIEDLEKFIKPLRERRKEFAKDIPKALAILKAGSEKAKKVAEMKMIEVREKIGVKIY
jgi:tryptophanyl-tRNA synthetase